MSKLKSIFIEVISRPAESVERMTLKRLRQYLPVTKVDLMRHKRDGWIRRIDVASAIFKCILQDRLKYIQGDYPVAWAHWQRGQSNNTGR